MTDLVGTCPKDFWEEWIAEGDPAGVPWSGEEWGWFTQSRLINQVEVGDRFYVVAHGLLRGYAKVTRIHASPTGVGGAICREGGAVAISIDEVIPGFRGLRRRWWKQEDEFPFPDWRTKGVVGTRVSA